VTRALVGYNSPGQDVRLVRNARRKAVEFWAGGGRLVPREGLVAEATARYRGTRGRRA
jgi:D-alanyl-D-alanine carboxypeptidase